MVGGKSFLDNLAKIYAIYTGGGKKRFMELGYATKDDYLASRKESRSVCYACMDYYKWVVPLLPEHPKLENLPVTEIVRDIVPMLKKNKETTVQKLSEMKDLSDFARRDEIKKLKGKKGS